MKQYKYYVKGTLKGSRSYETHTEDMCSEELLEYLKEIQELFPRDPDDELAQYIHDDGERDSQLYGVVSEIWVGVKVINKNLYSWTEISTNRPLTESEKEALLDYLSGQFSDGYGEGLEQREFNTYTETETDQVWDEDEQEYYEDEYDIQVNMYLHLWQSKNFQLEFVEVDTHTQKDEVKHTIKPKCKLIGEDGNIFNIMGIASRALRFAGLADKVSEMQNRVTSSDSYSKALSIICEYVEVE